MSDLSMYELEDIIWDDFDQGDDHVVPHPTNTRKSQNSFEGDSRKKPRRETTLVLSNTTNTIFQGKAERESKPLDKKKNMMEKESPPTSDFCVDDRVLSCTSAAGDNNSYSYSLTHKGDICFVDNNCEDKESGDLLYYGWPDIGNFDDVDKMLRGCVTSFGLGVTDKDDELGWFTSDQIKGTEEALTTDFKFPFPEPSGLKSILIDHDSPESNNHMFTCLSERKNELNFKYQSKHQNQTENDDGSFYHISDLTNNGSRLSSNNNFDQVLTDRQQFRSLEFDYFGHVQNNNSYQSTAGPMRSSYSFDEQKQARNSQGFQPLFIGNRTQTSMISDEKQARQIDIEGVQKGAEIGSLNVPESSSVSYELDDISIEATSLRHLRHAMKQLDSRTKLCIRDSLYRLARNSEQRHNNSPSISSVATNINDIGWPLMAERTNKCSGFMDMETDTNPIDRSVAHLLFHRPSESPNLLTPLPQKPNLGSIAGPMMISEKLVFQEEAAAESNDKIGGVRN